MEFSSMTRDNCKWVKTNVKTIQVALSKKPWLKARYDQLRRTRDEVDKPVNKRNESMTKDATSTPAPSPPPCLSAELGAKVSSRSSFGSYTPCQPTPQPQSAPQLNPALKKRPVPLAKDNSLSSDTPIPKRVKFHVVGRDPKETNFNLYAMDIVMRWDWPTPSDLDPEAKDRVHKEIDFIERTKILEQTLAAAKRNHSKVQREYKEAVEKRKDGQIQVKLRDQLTLQKGLIGTTSEAIQKLTADYNQSHQQKWEGVKQLNLWDREKLTEKQRDAKVAKWLKERSDKQKKQAQKNKAYTSSAPLAMQKGWARKAQGLPQAISGRTGAATKLRAPISQPGLPMPSPSIQAMGRKRKSPSNAYVKFDEDSEDDGEDSKAYQELLDRSNELIEERRLSDEGKSSRTQRAPRKSQRTGHPRPRPFVPAAEFEEQRRRGEAQAEREGIEHQRKHRKMRREIFPSGQSSEDRTETATETMDTPMDSGYETGSSAASTERMVAMADVLYTDFKPRQVTRSKDDYSCGAWY